MLAWFALHLTQALFTLARNLFNFGWVTVCPAFKPRSCLLWLGSCLILAWFAVHLAQVLFTLARGLFYFGLVALHLAQVLFNLATVLFNVGLVCLAFNPGLVYFG